MVGIAVLGAAAVAARGWTAVGAGLGLLVAAPHLSLRSPASAQVRAYKLGCRLTGQPFVSLLIPRPLLDELELSLAGLLIGLLVGMTGMGGGSLMTPLLVLVFGFKPTVAIGTDILHGAIFSRSARGGTARSAPCTRG